MKSYASIDRLEGLYVICEVELIEIQDSKNIDYCDRKTQMMDFLLDDVLNYVGYVMQGDILVVEHDGNGILQIYGKDYAEKQRRIKYIKRFL